MKVTVKLMEELFDEWNERAFSSSLSRPHFRVSNSKRTLGTYSFRSVGGHTICVSGSFDFSVEAIRDVLIHEMIHYYVRMNCPRSEWRHGSEFKYLMAKINREFGTHICVKGVGQDYEYVGKREMRYVYAIESCVHGNGFSVVAPSFKWGFEADMKRWADIQRFRLFITDDPYFGQFTIHRSKCGYTVKNGDYASKLKELETENNKLDLCNRTFWVPSLGSKM